MILIHTRFWKITTDLANPEALHGTGSGRRQKRQRRPLQSWAKHEEWLEVPLTEDVPQPSRLASRRGKLRHIDHIRLFVIPPCTKCASKPCSKFIELISMQSRRLAKLGEGTQFGGDELNDDPLVVACAFVSSSTTNGAPLFEDWDIMWSWWKILKLKMATHVLVKCALAYRNNITWLEFDSLNYLRLLISVLGVTL